MGPYSDEPTLGSTIVHVHERSELLEQWVTHDGRQYDFGYFALNDGEVLQPELLTDMDPDEEILEEYMGNYGPTLDLIYRISALVLWPKAKSIEILAKRSIATAVHWATTQLGRVSNQEMNQILCEIADLWPEKRVKFQQYNLPEMIRLIGETGNIELATEFLDSKALNYYNGNANSSLANLLLMVGPRIAKKFLVRLVEQHTLLLPKEVLSLVSMISKNRLNSDSTWQDVDIEIARSITAIFPKSLEEISGLFVARRNYVVSGGESEYVSEQMIDERSLDANAVYNYFALMLRLDLIEDANNVASLIADFPKVVTPNRMLPDALQSLSKTEKIRSLGTYRLLWQQSADFLLGHSSTFPEEPKDWKFDVEIPYSGDLASELTKFCLSAKRKTKHFRVAREKRKQIRKMIDTLKLDIDYETLSEGSPYTLICKKNRKGYEKRLTEYA